jgi:hypothetical protein
VLVDGGELLLKLPLPGDDVILLFGEPITLFGYVCFEGFFGLPIRLEQVGLR